MISDKARWRLIDRVLSGALARAPEDRDRYLAGACAEDSELRLEVESLLAADRSAAGFLEPDGASEAREQPLESGTIVGGYRLGELLGRGGMASVYEGCREQEPYQRQVAVKLVERGRAGGDTRRRFLQEMRALAAVEHVNVARMYDGGTTEDGRPFLVMELVDGEPINTYCQRHDLGVEERLRLFLQVCAALHAVHRHLLIHRDIKPANVLVTADATVKLLDFGIAKPLAGSPLAAGVSATAAGVRPMSLAYASPEQVIGGTLTTSSDVYCLGVLLFELLTGALPYEGDDWRQLEHAVREQSPPLPSILMSRGGASSSGRRLRGDLDNIVLMALRKEPERRYPSVAAFADDLERHLANRPVSARPDTLSYRAVKFLRRHRTGVAVTALAALLAAILLTITVVQGVEASHQRDLAQRSVQMLDDVFKGSDPGATGAPLSVQQLLDQGVVRVRDELGAEPESRAALLHTLGVAYTSLGSYDQARDALEEAHALRRRLNGDGHPDTAATTAALGHLSMRSSSFDEAAAHYERAIRVSRKLEDRQTLIEALIGLGRVDMVRYRLGAAERSFTSALSLAEKPPSDSRNVARCLIALGEIRGAQRRYVDSLALHRSGIELLRGRGGADRLELAAALVELAASLIPAGRLAEADASLRESLAIRQQTLGAEHPVLAENLVTMSRALRYRGELEEAESVARRSLALLERRVGPADRMSLISMNALGFALLEQGRYDEANDVYARMLAIAEELGLAIVRSAAYLQLGEIHLARRELDEARRDYERSREINQEVAPTHFVNSHVHFGVGRILRAEGRVEEALAELERAHRLVVTSSGEENWRAAEVRLEIALCLVDLGRAAEAEHLMRGAHDILLSSFGRRSRKVRYSRDTLVAYYRSLGREAEAASLESGALQPESGARDS